MRLFAAVSLVLLSTACLSPPAVAPPSASAEAPFAPPSASAEAPFASSSAPLLATLERTMCYGKCPAYRIAIHTDGVVDYRGDHFVKSKGERRFRIGAAELAALSAAFLRANYLSLRDEYVHVDTTDMPSANTSFARGGNTKSIRHDGGDLSAPPALEELEREVDRIVDIERWIGTKEERHGMPRGNEY